MSDCKQCPYTVGDTYQRDCEFPDCMGGWEKVYKELRGFTNEKQEEIERLRGELERLSEALAFYGNPENYLAIGFLPDPPCGEFMEDFSEIDAGHGPEFRPGKRARDALQEDKDE